MSAYAIIGLQFGSEGKGALAGYLAKRREPEIFISNWSPNAGHTYRLHKDHKLVRRMIPIGASISPRTQAVLIGPGSIIDPDRLIEECRSLPMRIKVIVHESAALVLPEHLREEKAYARIGSTMKGTAAASIARMHRDPQTPCTAGQLPQLINSPLVTVSTAMYHRALYEALRNDFTIQVEGCQGFSLSIYNGFYPYCTSRDTTIHQLKADICWPADAPMEVYGCLRTYPIRVANRAEGSSGPCYHDQTEIPWEALGVEPELTTVTQLPRRIFTFSLEQLGQALIANSPDYLYLSFCDYLDDDDASLARLLEIISECHGRPVRWQSFGPYDNNMMEIGYDVQERGEIPTH